MDIAPEDKGVKPQEEPVIDDEKLKKELALQTALNAEAEKKIREEEKLKEEAAKDQKEPEEVNIEKSLAAIIAERRLQEEKLSARFRRLKRIISALIIAAALIAFISVYDINLEFLNKLGPASPPVDTSSQPLSLDKTRVSFKLGQNILTVNDRIINMDVAPQSINGRVMLPISFVATALNCQVEWTAAEQKVSLKADSRLIEVWIGKSAARVNGNEMIIDPNNNMVTPTIVPPGRTMVPLRFLAESLGSQVDWNQEEQEVTITN